MGVSQWTMWLAVRGDSWKASGEHFLVAWPKWQEFCHALLCFAVQIYSFACVSFPRDFVIFEILFCHALLCRFTGLPVSRFRESCHICERSLATHHRASLAVSY